MPETEVLEPTQIPQDEAMHQNQLWEYGTDWGLSHVQQAAPVDDWHRLQSDANVSQATEQQAIAVLGHIQGNAAADWENGHEHDNVVFASLRLITLVCTFFSLRHASVYSEDSRDSRGSRGSKGIVRPHDVTVDEISTVVSFHTNEPHPDYTESEQEQVETLLNNIEVHYPRIKLAYLHFTERLCQYGKIAHAYTHAVRTLCVALQRAVITDTEHGIREKLVAWIQAHQAFKNMHDEPIYLEAVRNYDDLLKSYVSRHRPEIEDETVLGAFKGDIQHYCRAYSLACPDM
jgi:hypothetical protein